MYSRPTLHRPPLSPKRANCRATYWWHSTMYHTACIKRTLKLIKRQLDAQSATTVAARRCLQKAGESGSPAEALVTATTTPGQSTAPGIHRDNPGYGHGELADSTCSQHRSSEVHNSRYCCSNLLQTRQGAVHKHWRYQVLLLSCTAESAVHAMQA